MSPLISYPVDRSALPPYTGERFELGDSEAKLRASIIRACLPLVYRDGCFEFEPGVNRRVFYEYFSSIPAIYTINVLTGMVSARRFCRVSEHEQPSPFTRAGDLDLLQWALYYWKGGNLKEWREFLSIYAERLDAVNRCAVCASHRYLVPRTGQSNELLCGVCWVWLYDSLP